MLNNNGRSCADIRVMSRVVGFYAEINNFNLGKKEEFRMRKTYDLKKAISKEVTPISNRSVFSSDL